MYAFSPLDAGTPHVSGPFFFWSDLGKGRLAFFCMPRAFVVDGRVPTEIQFAVSGDGKDAVPAVCCPLSAAVLACLLGYGATSGKAWVCDCAITAEISAAFDGNERV